MGTPHLDHAGGFAYRALLEAVEPALGYPAGTNAIREIRNADVIVLLGADLTETHPVAKNEVIVAAARHKAQIVVVDSITTKLARRGGSLHLSCAPGSEHLIANAMLKWIIDQGLFDKTALALKADGLDELTASLADYSVENVSKLTGVDADLIRQAAKMYADAQRATIILTFGMNRLGGDIETAKAAVNLALLTGRIGKESCGVHLFGEKANAQGAVDMGLGPDLLPGFHRITDEAARAKFETVWGAPIPAQKGFDAFQILDKAEAGEIRGLYVVGENPLDTYPERTRTEKALGNLEFLVVQDLFLTSTAKMAHAVLPVASFAEKIGTYTSAERLVQRIRPVLTPAKGKSDMEIFTALAALMGSPSMTYAGPEQVMNEIASMIDVYRGISYDRLAASGLPWPCVDAGRSWKEHTVRGRVPPRKSPFLACGAGCCSVKRRAPYEISARDSQISFGFFF